MLANHAVVAYTVFGRFYPNHYLWSTAPIVDSDRWAGFNVLTLFNDAFFMSLMFLLSGLFVWPSLKRKGVGHFLRDRAFRLGLPYLALIFILMPIAYYASYRLTGASWAFSISGWEISGKESGSTAPAGSSGFCCSSISWRSRCFISPPQSSRRSTGCR